MFREHFGPLYIKPLTDEELTASLKEYSMLGLPGCAGSVDATFIPWDNVPTVLQNLCNGDKGKGLLYETIVTHSTRVIFQLKDHIIRQFRIQQVLNIVSS